MIKNNAINKQDVPRLCSQTARGRFEWCWLEFHKMKKNTYRRQVNRASRVSRRQAKRCPRRVRGGGAHAPRTAATELCNGRIPFLPPTRKLSRDKLEPIKTRLHRLNTTAIGADSSLRTRTGLGRRYKSTTQPCLSAWSWQNKRINNYFFQIKTINKEGFGVGGWVVWKYRKCAAAWGWWF